MEFTKATLSDGSLVRADARLAGGDARSNPSQWRGPSKQFAEPAGLQPPVIQRVRRKISSASFWYSPLKWWSPGSGTGVTCVAGTRGQTVSRSLVP